MPSSSYKSKQVIVMRRDLKMRKGKIAAQSGHACVEATLMAIAREGRADQIRAEDGWAYLEHAEDDRSPLTDWFDAGVAKICVYVALIRDAVHTEFHGEPTFTCLAFEPLPAETIDPITGNLPLY